MCDNELELSVCMRDYASAQENTERKKKMKAERRKVWKRRYSKKKTREKGYSSDLKKLRVNNDDEKVMVDEER